ncbi:MAG: hypothetical protein AAF468_20560 [Pseudomonadota bacterium]
MIKSAKMVVLAGLSFSVLSLGFASGIVPNQRLDFASISFAHGSGGEGGDASDELQSPRVRQLRDAGRRARIRRNKLRNQLRERGNRQYNREVRRLARLVLLTGRAIRESRDNEAFAVRVYEAVQRDPEIETSRLPIILSSIDTEIQVLRNEREALARVFYQFSVDLAKYMTRNGFNEARRELRALQTRIRGKQYLDFAALAAKAHRDGVFDK